MDQESDGATAARGTTLDPPKRRPKAKTAAPAPTEPAEEVGSEKEEEEVGEVFAEKETTLQPVAQVPRKKSSGSAQLPVEGSPKAASSAAAGRVDAEESADGDKVFELPAKLSRSKGAGKATAGDTPPPAAVESSVAADAPPTGAGAAKAQGPRLRSPPKVEVKEEDVGEVHVESSGALSKEGPLKASGKALTTADPKADELHSRIKSLEALTALQQEKMAQLQKKLQKSGEPAKPAQPKAGQVSQEAKEALDKLSIAANEAQKILAKVPGGGAAVDSSTAGTASPSSQVTKPARSAPVLVAEEEEEEVPGEVHPETAAPSKKPKKQAFAQAQPAQTTAAAQVAAGSMQAADKGVGISNGAAAALPRTPTAPAEETGEVHEEPPEEEPPMKPDGEVGAVEEEEPLPTAKRKAPLPTKPPTRAAAFEDDEADKPAVQVMLPAVAGSRGSLPSRQGPALRSSKGDPPQESNAQYLVMGGVLLLAFAILLRFIRGKGSGSPGLARSGKVHSPREYRRMEENQWTAVEVDTMEEEVEASGAKHRARGGSAVSGALMAAVAAGRPEPLAFGRLEDFDWDDEEESSGLLGQASPSLGISSSRPLVGQGQGVAPSHPVVERLEFHWAPESPPKASSAAQVKAPAVATELPAWSDFDFDLEPLKQEPAQSPQAAAEVQEGLSKETEAFLDEFGLS